MVKPIVTYVGKIKEVENRKDLILVMDALEVCYILDYLGYPESDDDDPMDFSGLFVSVVDGDCEEVFVFEGHIPYLYKDIWRIDTQLTADVKKHKTPEQTVNARLAIDIKKKSGKSRFIRTAPGVMD
jgi:hypothetical protein